MIAEILLHLYQNRNSRLSAWLRLLFFLCASRMGYDGASAPYPDKGLRPLTPCMFAQV